MTTTMNTNEQENDLEAPLLSPPPVEEEKEEEQEEPLEVPEPEHPAAPQGETDIGGQVQEPQYRDVWFAVFFVLLLLLMIFTAIWYGPYLFKEYHDSNEDPSNTTNTSTTAMMMMMLGNETVAPTSEPDDNNNSDEKQLVLWILMGLGVSFVAAVLACGLLWTVLERWSTYAVPLSFILAPLSMTLVAVGTTIMIGSSDTNACLTAWMAAVLTSAFAALHYLCCYRRYVAYTAANLQVALQALHVNRGLVGIAVVAQVVLVLYTAVAVLALGGLVAYKQQLDRELEVWVWVAWVGAVYWTTAVVQNVIVTATAGAVGAWWFGNTTSETKDSLHRALTYSFGSICMGSLLLAVAQVAELLANQARRHQQQQHNRDGSGILLCILEFLVQLLARLVEYFNSWAFIYIGLYGYKYNTAGFNVMTLFRQRGWSFVLTDRLLYQTLAYSKMAVAFLTGGMVVAVAVILGNGHYAPALFGAGAVVGMVLASIAFSVVESAVRTIIVCFCERPAEGALEHAAEVACLSSGWGQTYADEWQVSARQEEDEEEQEQQEEGAEQQDQQEGEALLP